MDLSRRSLFRSAIAFTLFSGLGLAACRSGTSGNGTASSGGSGTATAGALALCNAPWGVTDLKAAVRYLHYNSASLPGAMDKMFVFGHSGGGAQSSVMGASGDSPLYTRYLECLGAAMTFSDGTTTSDAIVGVTAWCPITGLQGFVTSQKSPSKDIGAFDAPDRSATENIVMGKGTQGLHFSKLSRDVLAANESTYSSLTGWSGDYAASTWDSDFATTDETGGDAVSREQMYEPLYYLLDSRGGQGSSRVAPNWRIRTGITQGDAASTVEINLALALQALGNTKVDFATVWGQGHTMAERTGDGAANFIAWVKEASA